MASVKITINGALMDAHKVTFKAPCDCVDIENLKVCYVKNGTQQTKTFTMKDAHGNDLTGIGNLFNAGAYVHVILNPVDAVAYLQNADTNGYLEERITPVNNLESDRTDLPLSAAMGKQLNKNITSLQTSFQTGLSQIAASITAKGVTTASNASPETMAENVKAIQTVPELSQIDYVMGYGSENGSQTVSLSIPKTVKNGILIIASDIRSLEIKACTITNGNIGLVTLLDSERDTWIYLFENNNVAATISVTCFNGHYSWNTNIAALKIS